MTHVLFSYRPNLEGGRCYNPFMLPPPEERALLVHERLLDHYGEPVWRTVLPPLDELVSTILSQSTNDDNRDAAFDELKARFDSWEQVRDAPPEEVIDAIRVAGLANQKGPRIQEALRRITEQRGELDLEFLQEWGPEQVYQWLLEFKGVGPKTAAIVMQFSLEMPAFPVDTHVQRVSGRIGLRPQGTDRVKTQKILTELFPEDTYYAAHLNIIHHGRQVCKARAPECARCVLTDLCQYYQDLEDPPKIQIDQT